MSSSISHHVRKKLPLLFQSLLLAVCGGHPSDLFHFCIRMTFLHAISQQVCFVTLHSEAECASHRPFIFISFSEAFPLTHQFHHPCDNDGVRLSRRAQEEQIGSSLDSQGIHIENEVLKEIH